MIVEILSFVREHIPLLVILFLSAHLIHNRYQKGLSKYPGPFLASFTNLWRLVVVWNRHPEKSHLALHREHGDVVRLGPNVLSFGTAAALKDIYGLNKGFIKSAFYPIQQGISGGRVLPSLFGTQDESYHARLRRCVNGAFSMTSLIQYEPSVDRIIRAFLSQTEKLYEGKECDFARWLQFYAFDVIGAITYSKAHGFVDRNEDVDGMVKYLAGFFDYVAVVGQIPILDKFFQKNPIMLYLNKLGIASSSGSGTVSFARARMSERLDPRQPQATEKEKDDDSGPSDLLHKFLQAKIDHPDIFNDTRVLTMSVSMAFAGSETTGISLSALFYHLLKNPSAYRRAVDEIRGATFADPYTVSFAEATGPNTQLPYLDACIKETFRLFPAAGLPLERIVPPQGATIAGRFVPAGTVVGASGWVVHREEAVFGRDPDSFVPERWLLDPGDQLKAMNASMIQFGMGARTCLGKNISLLEIYKLVPSFLRHFDLELVGGPESEWRTHNAWFIRQLDFDVRIQRWMGNGKELVDLRFDELVS